MTSLKIDVIFIKNEFIIEKRHHVWLKMNCDYDS